MTKSVMVAMTTDDGDDADDDGDGLRKYLLMSRRRSIIYVTEEVHPLFTNRYPKTSNQ